MSRQAYWITYETHPQTNPRGQGSYKKLKDTCKKNNLPEPVVLGAGSKWTGFSSKWRAVYKFCEDKDPNAIILVTDARDVLCNRNFRGLVAAFDKVSKGGDSVVFGSEVGCCVDTMKEYGPGEIIARSGRKLRRAENTTKWHEDEEYGDELDESGYYNKKWVKWFTKVAPKNSKSGVALNAGLGIATAKMWRKAIPKLKIQSDREDDQTLWSSLMFIRPKLVKLDYGAKIFTNTNVWVPTGCFVTWDSKRKAWRNRKTQTYSYVIQTPGAPNDTYKGKAWACYMELYKKIQQGTKK